MRHSDGNATVADVLYGNSHVFNQNNFLMSDGLVLRNDTANDINATGNYWGTANAALIPIKIYDRNDNFEKGTIIRQNKQNKIL